MPRRISTLELLRLTLFVAGLLLAANSFGQLFTNLQLFGTRLNVGDPAVPAIYSLEGPKGIATADFDGDGRPDLAVCNTDGTVTVFHGLEDGNFRSPLHLLTGEQELRGIVCADFTGDGRADIAVAAPYANRIFLFLNQGDGHFSAPSGIATWPGARNLAEGDFDGDGRPDLAVAGTTNGLRQLRNLGGGQFVTITNLIALGATNPDFPKPVYVLQSFRPPGSTSDELAVTHADTTVVWILVRGINGALTVSGTVTNQMSHALDIGPILHHAANGTLDLVTASRDLGTIEVHAGANTSARFAQQVTQRIQVPGGPRALEIIDVNGDGWNDLVVVLRNFDRVLTYYNSNGVLVAATEMPVGKSPRELVSADFNADGYPDVAVMNRDSIDVSILLTLPGQSSFSALDQIYPVDGEVSGLSVLDFNRDGRGDVIQLHRASAEFSVRLADTNGLLGPPSFYPMGSLPSAHASPDVNNDGYLDMVTANLGRHGLEPGSVSVRLGDGTGHFGPEQRYELPPEAQGSLFALVAADFDNDGNIDLAAGFFDCRLAFFRGDGQGAFTFTMAHRFVYESRVMVTGDFDQDGDLDIAGAGYAGDVVVVENRGDLLTTPTLTRYDYKAPDRNKFGTRDIVTADVNGDGDLDLLVGSGKGTMLFLGAEGMNFFRETDSLPGTDFPASAVAIGDFDGNGSRDVAVSCRILSCVTILSRDSQGQYQPTLSVDVPAGEFLASGDLDGDGKADLVGSGAVLWTALSSRPAQPAPPATLAAPRPAIPMPVINEILAINTGIPVEFDNDRNSDWVELFNGGATSLSLRGWKLRLVNEADGSRVTNEFALPPTAFLGRGSHLLVVCSEERRTVYHTGFRLPGGGGVLSLISPAGVDTDTMAYPAQQENVSYGRYRDGTPATTFNPYPSPNRPNTDNGPVEPVIDLEDVDLSAWRPDEPTRFRVQGRDDVGIVSLSLLWRRLDVPDEAHRVLLFDDGESGDGGMLDGQFAGLLSPGLPAGAEIQFYLEAVDLSGQTLIVPNEPVFAQPGQPVTLYSMAVGVERPALEISELVAANVSGLADELAEKPDWIEVRNCSSSPTTLQGITAGTRFFGNGSRFSFGPGDVLQPGEHRVIFCDNKPLRSARHAPFVLNREGDQVVFTGTTTNGARFWIDGVSFPAQSNDVAWARLGCGGAWRTATPTAGAQNVSALAGFLLSDRTEFTLVFPTVSNRVHVVEEIGSLHGADWRGIAQVSGDGIEKVVSRPVANQRFYRIRNE